MKKDPVLWVVVDRFRLVWVHLATTDEVYANDHVARMNKSHPHLAPFRVVKYLPAPKTKRKRKA